MSESGSGDEASDLPYSDEIKFRLQGLKSLEKRQIILDNKLEQERLQIEKKYVLLQRSLYERRMLIVKGVEQPTCEEVVEGEGILKNELSGYKPPKSALRGTTGIPKFWLTVFENSIDVSFMIRDCDKPILECLTDVTFSYLNADSPPDPSFRISFSFRSPNGFFKNSLLHKDYVYRRNPESEGAWIFDCAKGSKINWYEGKDVTQLGGDEKGGENDEDEGPSFFSFFSPPARPSAEDLEAKEHDEDWLEELEDIMEHDLDIGEAFKQEIIPNALDLFIFGEDDDEDEDEDDDDDEGEGEEAGEEDDDGSDEETDESDDDSD